MAGNCFIAFHLQKKRRKEREKREGGNFLTLNLDGNNCLLSLLYL